MRVVRVRHVFVLVGEGVVHVKVRVDALRHRVVPMGMVPVIVGVRMLVLHAFVRVMVPMALG
jgi:hypothetical protein